MLATVARSPPFVGPGLQIGRIIRGRRGPVLILGERLRFRLGRFMLEGRVSGRSWAGGQGID